jgi:hypothetical protein
MQEIGHLNERAWERYTGEIHWSVSTFAIPRTTNDLGASSRPLIPREREPLLHESLDLISRSKGAVWISAGDLSWVSELYVALLLASLQRREVRVLSAPRPGKEPDKKVVYSVVHLGANFSYLDQYWPVRATIASPLTDNARMLFLEDEHAELHQLPQDERLIRTMSVAYEGMWENGARIPGLMPSVMELSHDELIAALRTGVPRYTDLKIEPYEAVLKNILLLPRTLETFKLNRLNQLEYLRVKYDLPYSFTIYGFPTPTTPPVFERLPNGDIVVVDGAHRAYVARARGQTTISGLLVHNPLYDLQSIPMSSWDDIKPIPTKAQRKERYNRYSEQNFRPIRQAFSVLACVQDHN